MHLRGSERFALSVLSDYGGLCQVQIVDPISKGHTSSKGNINFSSVVTLCDIGLDGPDPVVEKFCHFYSLNMFGVLATVP